ncbi:MAG: type II secretion system protein GspM [Stellaceae bacterium]
MSVYAARLPLSPPLRRLLAVALLVAVLVLIAAGLILPIVDRYQALGVGISDRTAALQRFEAAAQRLPRLEREQAALKSAIAAQDGFLTGPNDSLIAAALQGRIKSVVDRAHAQLRSTQIPPVREEHGFRRFTARIEITGHEDSLARIWYAMETGKPFLFIDSFDVEARQIPRRDRTQPPMIILDTRFEVTAYARNATK